MLTMIIKMGCLNTTKANKRNKRNTCATELDLYTALCSTDGQIHAQYIVG